MSEFPASSELSAVLGRVRLAATSAPCAPDAARSATMHRRMRCARILAIAAVLCARAGVAHGAWTVDADGTCVRKWEPSDMLRGPKAMFTAPLQPVRTTAGGAEYAWNKSEWSPWYRVVLGSALTGVSAAAGTVEGVWWIGTGLADTLTGGYFEFTPERALDRSVQPQLSSAVSASPPEPAEDRCGRPLVAAK